MESVMDASSSLAACDGDQPSINEDVKQEVKEAAETLANQLCSPADINRPEVKREGVKTRKSDILNWEKKYHIIAEVEAKAKKFGAKAEIARKYGIARSTLSTLLGQKQRICALVEQGKNSGYRDKLPKFPKVDVALYEWYKECKTKSNQPITGIVLREKAEEFASMLGYQNAHISKPWIARWKQRHGLSARKGRRSSTGETMPAAGTESVEANQTLRQEPSLQVNVRDFNPSTVYHIRTFAMCWRLMPEETSAFIEGTHSSCSQAEERLTVVTAVSMTGNSRLDLLVIGAVPNPVVAQLTQVRYTHNPGACLTPGLLHDYFDEVNLAMRIQCTSITVYVDCDFDGVEEWDFSHIKVCKQLPIVKPESPVIHDDIVKLLKLSYRQRLQKNRLLCILSQEYFSYTLSNALCDISLLWSVTSERDKQPVICRDLLSNKQVAMNAKFEACQGSKWWRTVCTVFNVPQSVPFSSYVTAEDLSSTWSQINTVAVVADSIPSEGDEDDAAKNVQPPTMIEVAKAAQVMLRFMQFRQCEVGTRPTEGFVAFMDPLLESLMPDAANIQVEDPTAVKSFSDCHHVAAQGAEL